MSKICRIFAAEFKNATFMSKQKEIEIRLDRRNYRKHGEENKRIIKKSLEELGAGRSIVIDAEGEIIAGNGVFEQAQELGIKTKIVETDGSELVVVKRTDLRTQDEKRKNLAAADNAASDSSEWANDLLREDWTQEALAEFGVTLPEMQVQVPNDGGQLPEELQGLDLTPEALQKIQGDGKTDKERVIIVYDKAQEELVARMLGVEKIEKIVYNFDEL